MNSESSGRPNEVQSAARHAGPGVLVVNKHLDDAATGEGRPMRPRHSNTYTGRLNEPPGATPGVLGFSRLALL